jgi:hypothetical protein
MTGRLPLGAVVAAAFIAAAFVAACTPAPVIPPSPSVPSPAASASGPADPSALSPIGGTPPCRAEELVLDLARWEGAAGSRFAILTATTEQDRICSLTGSPGVAIVDGDNEIIIDWVTDREGGPRVDPGDPIVTVGPETAAALTIGITNWCDPPPPPPLGVVLTFEDESTQGFTPAEGTVGDLPPCLEPAAPPRVFVQAPWQPLN